MHCTSSYTGLSIVPDGSAMVKAIAYSKATTIAAVPRLQAKRPGTHFNIAQTPSAKAEEPSRGIF
jgi:hypothetical protein